VKSHNERGKRRIRRIEEETKIDEDRGGEETVKLEETLMIIKTLVFFVERRGLAKKGSRGGIHEEVGMRRLMWGDDEEVEHEEVDTSSYGDCKASVRTHINTKNKQASTRHR
jgi:hypothetical protein